MTTIAVIGLGAMGSPIARNLVAAGFEVRVWNRSPEKALAIEGATPAPTPRAAAEGAAFALTMLADDAAVEGVTFGDEGVLAGLPARGTHIGMSTISIALSARLDEAHGRAGQRFVAAPVFGRPDAAAARLLWIVPGGRPEDLERCMAVFAAIGRGIFPLATPVQAILAKLAGNFLIAATIESVAEALVLGEKGGIAPEKLLEMLTGTLFGSPVVKRYGSLIAATEFEPAGFALRLGLKDVNLALSAGEELRAPLPTAELVRDHLVEALARGRDQIDWSGLATVVREAAGLPPVRVDRRT